MSTGAVATAERGYHHGDLRAALVTAAVAGVEAHGAEHLSLRATAAQVGVSPSAAYHHFADKDALLGAVGLVGIEHLVAYVTERVEAIEPGTLSAGRARLHAGAQAYVDFALAHPQLFRVAFSGYCRAQSEQSEDGSSPVLTGLLNELVSTGGMSAQTRHELEDLVFATMHGIATLVLQGLLAIEDVPALLTKLDALIVLPE